LAKKKTHWKHKAYNVDPALGLLLAGALVIMAALLIFRAG